MRKLAAILLVLSSTWPALGQEVVTARRRAAAGGPPTSSPSASNVGSSSTATTGTTIPGTTFAGTSGSLVVLTSKTGTSGVPTVVFTLSGATCTASDLTTSAAGVVGGSFAKAFGWCLLSNSATVTPTVAWTGSTATFTDLTVTMFTSTSGFNASPLDNDINTSKGSGTSCASANTGATTNANDLVVGAGWNFNVAQTYGAGTTGFTAISASSRNTTTVQYKNVSATGVQSFTVAVTSDIWACDAYAFKMN